MTTMPLRLVLRSFWKNSANDRPEGLHDVREQLATEVRLLRRAVTKLPFTHICRHPAAAVCSITSATPSGDRDSFGPPRTARPARPATRCAHLAATVRCQDRTQKAHHNTSLCCCGCEGRGEDCAQLLRTTARIQARRLRSRTWRGSPTPTPPSPAPGSSPTQPASCPHPGRPRPTPTTPSSDRAWRVSNTRPRFSVGTYHLDRGGRPSALPASLSELVGPVADEFAQRSTSTGQ